MRWILIVLLVFLVGLQYRLWVGPSSWAQVASLERERADQAQVNERMQQRNQALEADIKALKVGLGSVEAQARSELGLIKKDETYYLIIDDKK